MNRNGNPFYVEPIIPDMSGQILELGKMGIQKDNLAQNRLLEERRLTGEETHRSRMFQNDTERLGIQKQAAETDMRKLPASQQNFSVTDFLPLRSVYANKGYDKALSPIFDRLDQWGKDSNVTKGVAANTLATQWDTFFKPQAVEGLTKEYLNRSKDPNFMGSPQEKELKQMIDTFSSLDGEKAKQIFFSSVAQEEANTKAAIQELRNQNQKPTVLPEGGVLLDDNGKPIYKNPRTFKPDDPDVKENKLEKIKKQNIDKAASRIDEHILRHYTIPNQNLEKKLEYKMTDEERRKVEKQIDYNNNQMMIAINTKNQLLNGELEPENVRWGGSGQTQNNRFKVEVVK